MEWIPEDTAALPPTGLPLRLRRPLFGVPEIIKWREKHENILSVQSAGPAWEEVHPEQRRVFLVLRRRIIRALARVYTCVCVCVCVNV